MYNDEDLAAAVRDGVLSQEAVDAFQAYMVQGRPLPVVDEEHFRLVSGFNDIFVVIACLLLLAALGWLGSRVHDGAGPLLVAATAWGLAEFFTRQRRLALPSIVLLLAFVGGLVGMTVAVLRPLDSVSLPLAGLLGGLGAWLHWRRFRVPITIAAGAAAVAGTLLAMLFLRSTLAREWYAPITFVAGTAVFALAMAWDTADPQRKTRRADVAFWLHLLAAPLLVHPIFTSLQMFSREATLVQAAAALLIYALLGLLSLAIDRRALMVSALAYLLYAFTALLKNLGMVSLSFAFTALCIGAALLLLSAFWHTCRSRVVSVLPAPWQERLPPLH